MTVHLQGIWAVIALGGICLLVCAPVWIGSLLLRDWRHDRIEAKFQRHLADSGLTPEEIDKGWDAVLNLARGGNAE